MASPFWAPRSSSPTKNGKSCLFRHQLGQLSKRATVLNVQLAGTTHFLTENRLPLPHKTIKEDEITETQEYLPTQFECIACGLKIFGLSRLNAITKKHRSTMQGNIMRPKTITHTLRKTTTNDSVEIKWQPRKPFFGLRRPSARSSK